VYWNEAAEIQWQSAQVKNANGKKHRGTKPRKKKRRMGQNIEWKKRQQGQNFEDQKTSTGTKCWQVKKHQWENRWHGQNVDNKKSWLEKTLNKKKFDNGQER
jgi:hypothetical protein